MFNFKVYPQKKYSSIEVYDIMQTNAVKGTASRYCITMKDWNDCANYLQHLLSMNELSSEDIILIIKGKHWQDFQLPSALKNKETQLKAKCSCDVYDLLRSKGCDCGHIVPYQHKNIFK